MNNRILADYLFEKLSGIIKIALLPFTLLYGMVIFLRNKLFDWKILAEREFKIPVIGVGNINVGGTGKTPHVEYLIRLLNNDFKIAVLSRGYKRKTKGFVLAQENPNPDDIGDEPCQIKQKFKNIIVAADASRRRGIKNLSSLPTPPDVILLDDSFQHRFVKPGMNILLMDYNKPAKNDLLLPSGRLREPLSSKKRARIILITKSPKKIKAIDMRIIADEMKLGKFQDLYFTSISGSKIKYVFPENITSEPSLFESKPKIILVSGIANPRQIKPLARKISTEITEINFGDHHDYSQQDIEKIISKVKSSGEDKTIVLTTEKDAVKLRTFESEFGEYKSKIFYLPIFVEFLNNDQEYFNKKIISYVRDNKRDSILHKS